MATALSDQQLHRRRRFVGILMVLASAAGLHGALSLFDHDVATFVGRVCPRLVVLFLGCVMVVSGDSAVTHHCMCVALIVCALRACFAICFWELDIAVGIVFIFVGCLVQLVVPIRALSVQGIGFFIFHIACLVAGVALHLLRNRNSRLKVLAMGGYIHTATPLLLTTLCWVAACAIPLFEVSVPDKAYNCLEHVRLKMLSLFAPFLTGLCSGSNNTVRPHSMVPPPTSFGQVLPSLCHGDDGVVGSDGVVACWPALPGAISDASDEYQFGSDAKPCLSKPADELQADSPAESTIPAMSTIIASLPEGFAGHASATDAPASPGLSALLASPQRTGSLIPFPIVDHSNPEEGGAQEASFTEPCLPKPVEEPRAASPAASTMPAVSANETSVAGGFAGHVSATEAPESPGSSATLAVRQRMESPLLFPMIDHRRVEEGGASEPSFAEPCPSNLAGKLRTEAVICDKRCSTIDCDAHNTCHCDIARIQNASFCHICGARLPAVDSSAVEACSSQGSGAIAPADASEDIESDVASAGSSAHSGATVFSQFTEFLMRANSYAYCKRLKSQERIKALRNVCQLWHATSQHQNHELPLGVLPNEALHEIGQYL